MIILYNKPECPFCWRIRMALKFLGMSWESRAYDDPQWSKHWASLTHAGTVPVMQWDERVLTDSADMLEALHDHSQTLWLGDSARDLARDFDGRLGQAVRQVVFAKRGIPEADWDYAQIESGENAWRALVPELDGLLEGKSSFFGEISAVDMIIATRFGLAAAYGMSSPLMFPNLNRWFSEVREQAWFRETAPDVVSAALEESSSWMAVPNTD